MLRIAEFALQRVFKYVIVFMKMSTKLARSKEIVKGSNGTNGLSC